MRIRISIGFDPRAVLTEKNIQRVLDKKQLPSVDELYAGIGFGNLQPLGVVNLLTKDIRQQRANEQRKQQEKELLEDHKQIENPAKEAPRSGKNNDHILIAGIDNMMVRLSRCCNPIPGDQIVGIHYEGPRGIDSPR